MNIYQKLVEIRKVVPYLQKANKNAAQGFNYVSSSQVIAAVIDKMNELGVLLVSEMPAFEVRDHHTNKSATGNAAPWHHTLVSMAYTWVNADDPADRLGPLPWHGQGVDSMEKGAGKAVTYAEKSFLLKSFNVPTDKDDPDAWEGRHDDTPAAPPPKRQPARKPQRKVDNPAANGRDALEHAQGIAAEAARQDARQAALDAAAALRPPGPREHEGKHLTRRERWLWGTKPHGDCTTLTDFGQRMRAYQRYAGSSAVEHWWVRARVQAVALLEPGEMAVLETAKDHMIAADIPPSAQRCCSCVSPDKPADTDGDCGDCGLWVYS